MGAILTSWLRSHRYSLALQQRTRHRGYGRHICSSFLSIRRKTMDCLVARVSCSGPNLILRARQMSHCPHEPRGVCSWISAHHTARPKEKRIYAQRVRSSASSSRAARWWTASSGGPGHPSLALRRVRRCTSRFPKSHQSDFVDGARLEEPFYY